MTDDRFDEFIRNAAADYHAPPETPRDEIWARIEAARRARSAPPGEEPIDLASRRKPRLVVTLIGIAAVLVLGIGIGRWTVPELGDGNAPGWSTVELSDAELEARERSARMVRVVAVEHLGRIDALLTDYQIGATPDELQESARSLLSRTRLLLGSPRLTDSTIRRLLSDLELVLLQVAQIRGEDGDDRALIDESLTEQAIRPRVRQALRTTPGLTI